MLYFHIINFFVICVISMAVILAVVNYNISIGRFSRVAGFAIKIAWVGVAISYASLNFDVNFWWSISFLLIEPAIFISNQIEPKLNQVPAG